MAGNVNEWVMDVYRPMTSIDANDFNAFRGNIFKTKLAICLSLVRRDGTFMLKVLD
jgi:hypothetical protein